MFLKFLADAERVVDFHHEVSLGGCHLIGLLWVNSWEVTALHLIRFAVDGTNALRIVDVVKQTASEHAPFWMTFKYRCFLLELDDSNSLMHLSGELTFLVIHRIPRQQFGQEFLAGVIAISLKGKGGQRYQVDSILFDGSQVCIAQTQTQHVTDTGIIAC